MQIPFIFGIYPGGEAGSNDGIASGRAADPAAIERCLHELQGTTLPFVIRAYERFSDADHPSRFPAQSPADYEQYLHSGRLLDLVMMYQSAKGDVSGYIDFVRERVTRYAPYLYSAQATLEASFTEGPPVVDGPYPRVQDALVQGVVCCKQFLRSLGRPVVKVGFSTTPTFGPAAAFWKSIGTLGGADFREALDYVGLDFYPDVFMPVKPDNEPGNLRDVVQYIVNALRNEWMPAAGLGPELPIDIAEHGWPTGPTRSPERQAEVLETVVRTLWADRERMNLYRYTLFALRDADSSKPEDLFSQFGIVKDDYSAKPAFGVYQKLIAELR